MGELPDDIFVLARSLWLLFRGWFGGGRNQGLAKHLADCCTNPIKKWTWSREIKISQTEKDNNVWSLLYVKLIYTCRCICKPTS